MQVIKSPDALTAKTRTLKNEGNSIGFVPTMGALHKGHLALINQARKANNILIVSIFVNPTQFDDPDDYRNYPRTREQDQQMLEEAGCDILFMPGDADMYPQGKKLLEGFDPGYLAQVLEGQFRPGHFQGVATIVKKLFDVVQPHKAYFGLKDYQQLLVIEKLVSDFEMGIQVVPAPIVREPDGLATSSRNVLLSAHERAIAPVIYQTLQNASEWLNAGKSVESIRNMALETFGQYPELKPEYFELRDADSLARISDPKTHSHILICTAVQLGKVRLIDNFLVYN